MAVAAARQWQDQCGWVNPIVLTLVAVLACVGDGLILPQEGEPATLVIVGGDDQADTVGSVLPDSLVVRITDRGNRPIMHHPVRFVGPPGETGGYPIPDIAETDADGRARVRWVLGTVAGPQTITASASTLTADFHVAAITTGPDTILATSGDSQAGVVGAELSRPLVATVTDRYGNPVSGVTATWSAVGGGSVTPTTTVTDLTGQVSARRTLGPSVGERQTVVTAPGLKGSPVVFVQIAFPGAVGTKLALSTQPSTSVVSGQLLAQQPVVQVLDAGGNAVSQSGVVCSVTLASGSPALGGTLTATTNAAGAAAFTDLSISGPPGPRTLRFSSSGLLPVSSNSVDVQDISSTWTLSITVQPSVSAANGATLLVQPAALVLDQNGLPVGGVSVTAAVASGGGVLGGQLTVGTSVLGIATFSNLSLTGTVGSYTLRISAGVPSATTGVISLTPGPASASRSAATVPSQGNTNRETLIGIETRDQSGNRLTLGGHTVEITVTGKNPHGRFAASDKGDGSYTASYTPTLKGRDSIAITLDGAPIGGSPYTSDVH